MPHPKLASIRQRFHYACGYCGVTETATGSELTIDHYRPKSAGGEEDNDNLVYACVKCNQYKGDFWPDEDDIEMGRRVLHPLFEDFKAHVVENEQTCLLQAISDTGDFHIKLLRLNRPQLVEYRLARRIQAIVNQKLLLLEQQIMELEKTIQTQERYITMLEIQLTDLR